MNYHFAMRLLISLTLFALAYPLHGGEAEIAAAIAAKGGKVTQAASGTVTAVSIPTCAGWTAEDYGMLAKLPALKMVSFGQGFDDTGLKAIGVLTEVENFSSNGMNATDDGIAPLAEWKKLKSVAFFHPGKSFTGTGLRSFTDLPALERLTVAGSLEFGDAGMAAVGTLTQLQQFRTWHTGVTVAGVKELWPLKKLTSLTLGQRLSYKPPLTVSDEVVPLVAKMTSLQSLSLAEARLSAAALGTLRGLKVLTLDGIEITGGDAATVKEALAGVEVKWTAPNEVYRKRIEALFGKP